MLTKQSVAIYIDTDIKNKFKKNSCIYRVVCARFQWVAESSVAWHEQKICILWMYVYFVLFVVFCLLPQPHLTTYLPTCLTTWHLRMMSNANWDGDWPRSTEI